VDEATQDRVGVGRVADGLMPAVHGKLGRDDPGAASVSLLEDFEHVLAGGLRRAAPGPTRRGSADRLVLWISACVASVAARL